MFLSLEGGGNYSLDDINNAAYEASKASLVPCDNCGRKFASDRIHVHQRSCRPGNAAKSIGVGDQYCSLAHPLGTFDLLVSTGTGRTWWTHG